MSGIPEEIIEQVRDAADIVAIIGEHVDLRRTGADYRGPCPMHGGTNRNFSVIPRKQMFYCFVCHEGGDVFTFYMKRFGMEYPTAVREVAKKVGIVIPDRPSGGPDPREPLYSAVAVAADWYARRLRDADDAKPAREYLQSRGFDLERMLPHGLGFAPRGDEFLAGMETFGIGTDVLLQAGLAVERDDRSVRPRLWNRLLFPIHDLRGRIVGFGGRVLADQEPKYLNSPDSEIFHKGRLLYHLHEAKLAIRKAERAVVVEGYFDVLRLAEIGIEEVIAPLGTAFTADQAQLLKRYTKDVILLFDSDSAGMRASFRSADELLRQGLRVQLATVPPGEDPDTLAQRGGREAVEAILDDALDVLERKLQLLERKTWLGSVAGRRRALDRLLPTLRATADPVTRDLYIGRTAEALGVSVPVIAREVATAGDFRQFAGAPRSVDAVVPTPRIPGPEWNLLKAALYRPPFRPRIWSLVEERPIDPQLKELIRRVCETEAERSLDELIAAEAGAWRPLLEKLTSEPLGEAANADEMVNGAVEDLERRTLRVESESTLRSMGLLSPDEQTAKLREEAAIAERKRAIDTNKKDWKGYRRR